VVQREGAFFCFWNKSYNSAACSFAAFNSPTWAKSLYSGWQEPLFISVAAGVISIAAAIVYIGLDVKAEKNYALKEIPKQDKIIWKDTFTYSKSYWYIILLCVTFYSAIFPFQTFAVKFFIDVHHADREYGDFL